MATAREQMIIHPLMVTSSQLQMFLPNATAKLSVMMMLIALHMNLIAARNSVTIGSRRPREINKRVMTINAPSNRRPRRRSLHLYLHRSLK